MVVCVVMTVLKTVPIMAVNNLQVSVTPAKMATMIPNVTHGVITVLAVTVTKLVTVRPAA